MRRPLASWAEADRAVLVRTLRVPVLTFVALTGLLSINVALGATQPFERVWIAELVVVTAMAALIILVSMEVRHAKPLIRLFAGIGFVWVAILFGMTLTDYLTR